MNHPLRTPSIISLRAAAAIGAVLALALPAIPASALTGGEVMEKMTSGERAAWIYGAGEMAGYLSGRLGDAERRKCIYAWTEDTGKMRELHAVFLKNPDKQAAGLLDILLQRHCGKLQPGS